ncbi:glycosyltransferase family 61 protein [Paenibacillus cremeus]|nr:glycosyltransferase family 61 protein [Paenibacillus cremeus]
MGIHPPKGHYELARDCIARLEKRRFHEFYKEFYTGELLSCTEAKTWNQPLQSQFQAVSIPQPPSFTAVVRKGRVWGGGGAIVARDNRLISDVSIEWDGDLKMGRDHPIFKAWSPYPLVTTNETIGVLAFCGSNNYFHWMYDVLPRLDLLQRTGVSIDRYLIKHCDAPYQTETLAALGIPKEKLLPVHDETHLKARRLVVPSSNVKQGYARWSCDYLRHALLPHGSTANIETFERIYVSRASSQYRRVTNEQELCELLSQHGFRTIQLETLTVAEQIRLFAVAKAIVSPHGAGLTNLTFCSPGTKVIELFSPDYAPSLYWLISNHVNLDYYCLFSDQFEPGPAWAGASNLTVDVAKLTELLRFAGII